MNNSLATYAMPLPDLAATAELASRLAKLLKPGLVIYLQGELGAGKTTLVRDILAALGHKGITKSPTYTLVETYDLGALRVNHFDLYRLSDPSELEFIGIRDYVGSSSVCIFEWPQKGAGHIPAADIEITLELHGNSRKAVIRASTSIIQALQDANARNT